MDGLGGAVSMLRALSRALAVALVTTLSLVACGDDGLGGAEERALVRAVAQWQSLALTYYTVEERVSCFCPPELQAWHEITVANDSVIAARRVEDLTAGPLPAPTARPEWFATVDDLFRRIAAVQRATDGSRVEATYDPTTGLPTLVNFFAQPGVADGDAAYRLRALKPGLVQ